MAEHTELDDGLWLSVTELAERKGVRKSTISEKVTRLVEAGLLTVKPGKGKQKLINLAQYDIAIGEVGDVAKEQGAATKAAASNEPSASRSDVRFRDEATREKAYNADLKFIELEKARGNLLHVAEFDAAAEDVASRIADIVDDLQSRDADLTSIAIKEGENGMRAALKRIVRAQREAIVIAMRDMSTTARARAQAASNGLPVQAELPAVSPAQ